MARRESLEEDTRNSSPNYDKEDFRELFENLRINEDQIDVCAITHAHDFFHACRGYAYAVAERDACKLDVDQTTARVDKDVRDTASSDNEKVTEAVVASRVKLDPLYDRAYRKFLKASLQADLWRGLVDSFRQRGDMLRILESQR